MQKQLICLGVGLAINYKSISVLTFQFKASIKKFFNLLFSVQKMELVRCPRDPYSFPGTFGRAVTVTSNCYALDIPRFKSIGKMNVYATTTDKKNKR